jgi:hypothetical protein
MTKSNRRTIRAFTQAGGTLLFTAAIALGTTTLGYPAIAGAQPNNGGGTSGEWDIGAYDFCMSNHPPLYTTEDVLDHHRMCCESTGGVWGSGDNGCHAPPGELNAPTDPFGGSRLQAPPPGNVQAPPPPVNPTAPVNPGNFG